MDLLKEKKEEEDDQEPCKYWDKCFQKNPDHFKKYKHPLNLQKKIENEFKGKAAKRKSDDLDLKSVETPNAKKQNISISTKDNLQEIPEKVDSAENDDKPEIIMTVDDADEIETSESSENNEKTEVLEINKDIVDSEKTIKEDITENVEKSTFTVTESEEIDDSKDVENSSITEDIEKADKNLTKNTEEVEKILTENTKDPENMITESNNTTNSDKIVENQTGIESSNKVESQEQVEDDQKTKSPEKILNFENNWENILSDAKELISKIFLMPMPDDFYKFFELCKELKPSDPATAFQIADLQLVGPYDVLLGLIDKETPITDNLLTHWRYFYDPPEFQCVVKGNDKEGLHFGYWRDRPSTSPVFVATNCCNVSHKIKPIGENIFGAVVSYLEERAKKVSPYEKTTFFTLFSKVKVYAKKYNIPLESMTPKMKSREKNVLARTIHGAGIVCPFNKITKVGYRELCVTENQLLKIVKKINDAATDEHRLKCKEELDEIIQDASAAADECNFGTCLELGHNLLSTGCVHVQDAILNVLDIAYSQLERHAFLKIIKAHMANRRQGTILSAILSK